MLDCGLEYRSLALPTKVKKSAAAIFCEGAHPELSGDLVDRQLRIRFYYCNESVLAVRLPSRCSRSTSNKIIGTNFAGIRLVPQFGGVGSNTDVNTLTNNTITGNLGSGIAFEGAGVVGTTQISDNLMQGNILSNSGGAGIVLTGNANTATGQNTVTGNTIMVSTGDGVRITGATATGNAVYATPTFLATATWASI